MGRWNMRMGLMALWALAGATAVSAEVLVKPNDPNINYYGRFDQSSAATSVPFNWPGSLIEATFTGPSIGVELNTGGGAYFNVEIDGVRQDSLAPSTTTHRTIRTDLSAGTHTIRVTLRSNGNNCAFGGFYLADGNALSTPPAKPARKIEFIGDSWTAGDVINQTTGNPDNRYFNATQTYARLTTNAFHAQDILVARGGAGLVKSQSGAAVMGTRYPKTLCDGTANWNFASWTPDLVVMSLGINDSTIGGVSDTTLRAAYRALITTVRGNYPNVPLILMGINGTNLRNVNVVSTYFPGTTVFSSPITLSNAKALYQHPNAAQHKQISDSLVKVVTKVMGWDTAASTAIRVPRGSDRVSGQAAAGGLMLRLSQDEFALPSSLAGSMNEVIAYDYSGRLAGRTVTPLSRLSLVRDLGLAQGVYWVSVKAARR